MELGSLSTIGYSAREMCFSFNSSSRAAPWTKLKLYVEFLKFYENSEKLYTYSHYRNSVAFLCPVWLYIWANVLRFLEDFKSASHFPVFCEHFCYHELRLFKVLYLQKKQTSNCLCEPYIKHVELSHIRKSYWTFKHCIPYSLWCPKLYLTQMLLLVCFQLSKKPLYPCELKHSAQVVPCFRNPRCNCFTAAALQQEVIVWVGQKKHNVQ